MWAAICCMTADPTARIERALRDRDADALDELVDIHGDSLLRYLIHLTGDPDLARDVFQDTWLRVLERGHRYDPRRPFLAWLFTVARNRAIDLLRIRRPLSIEALEEPDGGGAAGLSREAGPSPFDSLAARERHERVSGAMGGLPAAYREVLFLRFAEELSLKEVALITGLALPTVKSRLYRGLQQLASRLGDRT